ncbi:MAG: sodium/calcium exchanger membrane protein [Phycisphaerae bacterium]|nr:MAG: sodium/calcium exchanger membrane protein [Phycisphaerae bacterium]
MLTQWLYPNNVTTPMLLGEMLIAGAIVVLIAIRLTKLADRFADEWNLGKAFVGMLLLATVTSLPEVVAGATAAAIGSVDMAFAAVYGSCSFNIVIIVIMNLALAKGGSVLSEARPAQLLNSSFGIVMIVFSISAIATVQKFAGSPIIQQTIEIVSSLSIIVTYIWFMMLSQRFERRDAVAADLKASSRRPKGIVVALLVVSFMTVMSAWWLTKTGDVLSEHPIEFLGRPLGKTAIGICFLAAATSLPEIATSLTAVRINNLDMALGNVFGSNMFNMLVVPVIKFSAWCTGDSLCMYGENFSANLNMLAGLFAVMMMAIALAGIAYRTRRRVLKLGVDSVVLLLVYVTGMTILLTQH